MLLLNSTIISYTIQTPQNKDNISESVLRRHLGDWRSPTFAWNHLKINETCYSRKSPIKDPSLRYTVLRLLTFKTCDQCHSFITICVVSWRQVVKSHSLAVHVDVASMSPSSVVYSWLEIKLKGTELGIMESGSGVGGLIFLPKRWRFEVRFPRARARLFASSR